MCNNDRIVYFLCNFMEKQIWEMHESCGYDGISKIYIILGEKYVHTKPLKEV